MGNVEEISTYETVPCLAVLCRVTKSDDCFRYLKGELSPKVEYPEVVPTFQSQSRGKYTSDKRSLCRLRIIIMSLVHAEYIKVLHRVIKKIVLHFYKHDAMMKCVNPYRV